MHTLVTTLQSLRAVPITGALALLLTLPGCPSDDAGDDANDATSGSPTGSSSTDSTGPDPTGTDPTDGSTSDDVTSSGPSTETTTETGDDTGTSTGAAGLEIAGTWIEDLGGGDVITHTVDERTWDTQSPFGDSLYFVDSFDNETRFVVAQGDAGNEFFPELYSKFNWHFEGDALYYCTSVFDAATAADAIAAPNADSGDLMAGCGGFPWSPLQPQ